MIIENTLAFLRSGRERGMRSIGATQFRLKKQLQEWLELSTLKHVPISLLIMSRALMLRSGVDGPEQGIKSSLSSLDSGLFPFVDRLNVAAFLIAMLNFASFVCIVIMSFADTINEVVLASASAEEKDTVEMRRRKLESLQFQNEVQIFFSLLSSCSLISAIAITQLSLHFLFSLLTRREKRALRHLSLQNRSLIIIMLLLAHRQTHNDLVRVLPLC